ncbi:MAG: CoA-binding protein [Thermodesulfobacteriota bacterium]|nr:CoA-binding protein [Thermodesulfobacteriota bacterium]
MHSVSDIMESKGIVVIGASRDPFKPGAMLIEVLKSSIFEGNVAGINPQGGEIHGIPLYLKLEDVPFCIDLAVLLIPPKAVPQALIDCSRKDVKGVVIASEGFAEAGPQGRQYQEEVRTILQSSKMRGFGPNTLGVINTATGLTTSYFATEQMLKPGSIGFAAQSGVFVGGLLMHISSIGLHISKGVGLGNKVDVDESDVLPYFMEDEQTRTVGLYLEDIRDGRRFLETARNTVKHKPVLMLKGGRSFEGAHAMASHTASLAVDDAILIGALRQAGVLLMGGTEEFVGTLMGFDWMPLPKGNRIALVTYSGAQAVMCVDKAIEAGLQMASFTEETHKKLSKVIATPYKRQNPIDIYPDMTAHGFEATCLEILRALMDDDGVHGVIVISFATLGAAPFLPLVEVIQKRRTKPVFFSVFGPKEDVNACQDLLAEHRIPFVYYPELAAQAFAHMWRYTKIVKK